jgi:hypothetical protein
MAKKAKRHYGVQIRRPWYVLHRWRVALTTGTPTKLLGYVSAANEASAIETAAEEFRVGDALRNRLVAQREG